MEKFIVSARKYRPQLFETVVGQSHITTTLKNAIRHNQLAHAFLFCGPRGVGKTTCARILAKTINCENRTKEGEACNTCHSCVSFNEGSSLNIHELDAASNNSVDDIRTLVDQVRFAPQAGKYKVYIIDEVHMLSSSAFNAFLKTLEEPPPYAIFILATTEKHKILPTILSRCQIFDFKRITLNDTVEHLEEICKKETIKAEKAALQIIAQKSEGCMRDALSILDKIVSFTNGEVNYKNTLEHLNILDADYYFQLLDCMLQQDLSGAMLLYDDINNKGFEGDLVLNGLAEFIRNILVCKDDKAAVLLEVVESFKDKYRETAKKVSPSVLISALNIISEAEINYRSARNKKLHVELTLIKLCYLQQALSIVAEGHQLSKKKLIDSAQPVAFRKIKPIEIKKPGQPAGMNPSNPQQAASPETAAPSAKLILETQKPETKTVMPSKQETIPVNGKGKLTALNKIRNQVKGAVTDPAASSEEPLVEAQLIACWNDFVKQLKKEKNSAAQSFELAILRILDKNSFEAVTANSLEQKFLEKERIRASEFLQEKLKNRSLQFSILLEDKPELRPKVEAPPSIRDQFIEMAKEYPLVKELKDKLGLELDY
ncbi:MAG: DNA polymerase III subunit gamma/tau [Terrimonas sp.]|nr:DNA polymerase III subunit gamma/tau [Terrimonas sp.]